MNFDPTVVKNAYDLYLNAITARDDIQASIDALGARPEYPDVVEDAPDYNDVTALQTDWDNNYRPLKHNLDDANLDVRTAELNVLAVTPPRQWVHVHSGDNEQPAYSSYIGYDNLQRVLQVVAIAPTKDFPEV